MRLSARVLVSFCAITFTASLGAQTSANNAQTDSSRVTSGAPSAALVSFVIRDTTRTATAGTSAWVASTASGGAALTGLRAGAHVRETRRPDTPNAQATHANLGQARALMIVGVGALIAGAIIGGTPGTIIMVGGAVIGLYGLYDYLQ